MILNKMVRGEKVKTTPLTLNPVLTQTTYEPQTDCDGFSKVILNPVTSNIDPFLYPENIREGVTILGVYGELKKQTQAFLSYAGLANFAYLSKQSLTFTNNYVNLVFRITGYNPTLGLSLTLKNETRTAVKFNITYNCQFFTLTSAPEYVVDAESERVVTLNFSRSYTGNKMNQTSFVELHLTEEPYFPVLLQNKTIYGQGNVTQDSGYHGLSRVAVKTYTETISHTVKGAV